MEFKADSSVKRVVKNSYSTAASFAVFTLSGFFFVPFLVKQYGVDRYGLVALAGFLTQYIGFIAGCIGSSIGRFLNVALNKNDWKEANEVFATALIGTWCLIVLQLPFYVWSVCKLDVLIEFPPEVATDFRTLVSCNIMIFFISLIMGIYATPIHAANRVDIPQKQGVLGELLRLILLVILILTVGPKLWIIGAVGLAIACVQAVATCYFSKRLAPLLKFERKHVAWKWVRPVMNMAVWSIVAGLGQILFQKTDVWIVNRFIDVRLAGVCAALLIWPNFVQQIAKTAGTLLGPVVMIDYSQGRFVRIRDLVLLTTKLLSVGSLFICGGVMVFGKWLLEIWMGEDYGQYHWILVLMLLHFPLTLARETVWLVFPAFNKMQYLGISNIISGVLNIVLSLVLAFMGFGLPGVVVATGISLILQRTVFLSYLATKLLDVKYRQFLSIYAWGLLLIVVVVLQRVLSKGSDFTSIGVVSMVAAVVLTLRIVIFDHRFKDLIVAVVKRRD